MPRPSFVIVVAEDEKQRMIVYRYLRKNGLFPRQIRTKTSPSGQGSAEQWVRSTYSDEVKAHRIRCARATAALIVVIDADTETFRVGSRSSPEHWRRIQYELSIMMSKSCTWFLSAM
jgi:hypothetical protein